MYFKSVRPYDCKNDEKKFRKKMTNVIFTSQLELERNAKVGLLRDNKEVVFFDTNKSPKVKIICSVSDQISDEYKKQIFSCFNKNKIDQICRKLRDRYLFEKKIYLQSYTYNTENFLLNANKSKDVKRFKKKYSYKILSTYDKNKIYELYDDWSQMQASKSKSVAPNTELDFFFASKNIKKYKIRFLFLEVDGRLVGAKIAYPFLVRSKKILILRYQFSRYEYYGINQFMTYELIKREREFKEFSDGGEFVSEKYEGRRQYKLSRRRPDKIEDIYRLEITKKIL